MTGDKCLIVLPLAAGLLVLSAALPAVGLTLGLGAILGALVVGDR